MLVNIRIGAHSYLFRICRNRSLKFFDNIPWWVPCAENCNSCFFAIFWWKSHKKANIWKVETVLILLLLLLLLLLLKRMTKTSQLNEMALMIYWWVPCAKNINSLFFAIILMKIKLKTWKWKNKRLYNLLKPMTKTSQLNGKFREDVFRRALSPKWPFKMAAWRCLHGL